MEPSTRYITCFMQTDISTNESFTFRNAMKQDDKIYFVDAKEKEISDHKSGKDWSIFHRDALPNIARPIKSICSFKRKHKSDVELLKHKARKYAHGGMLRWGDIHWETYSPVVNMLTVRLILAIDKLYNLDSKAIDFVLAFPEADLEEDIFQVNGQSEADSDRN